jgi:hypothetical protein
VKNSNQQPNLCLRSRGRKMRHIVALVCFALQISTAFSFRSFGGIFDVRKGNQIHFSPFPGPFMPSPALSCRRPVSTRMAVGDIISVEWGVVSEVQDGIRAAMADGHRLLEVEVPTTNKFKDKALNQIYQANTEVARTHSILHSMLPTTHFPTPAAADTAPDSVILFRLCHPSFCHPSDTCTLLVR